MVHAPLWLPWSDIKDAQSPGARDLKGIASTANQAMMSMQSSAPDMETERERISLWAYRTAQAMFATAKRHHVDENR